MKKIYKYFGLISLLLFSFYYTEKIALIMQNKSPLMQNINNIENDLKVDAVNAIITGDYIIPGIDGKKVNKTKSYVNMKSFGVFNEYYLIFDEIKPDVSLLNNKDKIIKKGNNNKKGVAFLLENNETILNYLEREKIKGSLLIKEAEYNSNSFFEQVNNDSLKYKNIESLLNHNNKNTNLCYIETLGKDFCLKEKKFLIEETFSLNGTNIVEAKNLVENGAIILIKKEASLEHFKLLVKNIKFKGLNILTVSELIDEKK